MDEVSEEVVDAVFGGVEDGVVTGVEAEDVAMEVMIANYGALVEGAVVRIGEEHLGEVVIASAIRGRAGADAAVDADGEVMADAIAGAAA